MTPLSGGSTPTLPATLFDLVLVALVWLLALVAGLSLFSGRLHYLNREICVLSPVFLVIAWLPPLWIMNREWNERAFCFALLSLPVPAVLLTFAFMRWSARALREVPHGSKNPWWLQRPVMGSCSVLLLAVSLGATLAVIMACLY